MVCPYCLSSSLEIYNSRPTKKLNQVWRRRRCLSCKKVFTTTESVDLSFIVKIKNQVETVAYQPGILLASLLRACDHRADQAASAFYLLQICQETLLKKATSHKDVLTSRHIAEIVATILGRFDTLAWAKYNSYHNIAFDKTKLQK